MSNISQNMLIILKKTWDGIKNIVNIKKNSNRTSQLNVGGKIIDDDKEIATNFNNFFVNVGPNTEGPRRSQKFLIYHLLNF